MSLWTEFARSGRRCERLAEDVGAAVSLRQVRQWRRDSGLAKNLPPKVKNLRTKPTEFSELEPDKRKAAAVLSS